MKTYLSPNIFFLFILCFTLCFADAHALAPVESLVLGNFTDAYSEGKTDPLNYVFSRDQALAGNKSADKLSLATYRGFYEEGKNLTNYCKENREIRYSREWEKVQVKRSTMALIQYIGLDLISRAIPQYAKQLEFSKEEYSNMVEGLVGNYCSSNLSVISKKELLNNLMLKFDKENTFELPQTKNNNLFPQNLDEYVTPKKGLENEMLYTVKLFQGLCSWSGNPSNAGLMVPILRHSGLMAFFIRQMSSKSIEWKAQDNSLYLNEDNQTVKIWCENLICRKVSRVSLEDKVYYSVGGTNIGEDLKRLYCEDFRSSSYHSSGTDDKIVKMMNTISFDEENFINGQFIALITGVPDFLLRLEKFSGGEDLIRSSMDDNWNKWAKQMSDDYSRDLFFEEPLMLELIDRAQYTHFMRPELKIAFDINLGEFDRINQRVGKTRVSFNLKVLNSFLKFYRQALKDQSYGEGTMAEKARLANRFKLQITKDVQAAREKFIIPPWKGDLEGLIVTELTAQMLEKPERLLKLEGTGLQDIIVEINYGVFALKYINHQLNVLKNRKNSSVPLPALP